MELFKESTKSIKYEKYPGFEQNSGAFARIDFIEIFLSQIYISKMYIWNLLKNYSLSKKLITIWYENRSKVIR